MSVIIRVLREQDSEGKEYGEPAFRDSQFLSEFTGTIGYVIAAVVRNQETGAITLERDLAVTADNTEDNTLAEATVKEIERKLNEAFPDPNRQEPTAKLWVPE